MVVQIMCWQKKVSIGLVQREPRTVRLFGNGRLTGLVRGIQVSEDNTEISGYELKNGEYDDTVTVVAAEFDITEE